MPACTQTQINKLNRLYKAQDELYHDLAVRFGLSDTALWVLYAVCSSDKPRTQYDLASDWCFPKQTVNSAISNLAKVGHIKLCPVPGTRNRKNVSLTAQGEAFCARTVQPLLAAEKRALLRFSEEERQLYLKLFEEQITNLKAETDRLGT